MYPSEVTHLQLLSSYNPDHNPIHKPICCHMKCSCWSSRPRQAGAGAPKVKARRPVCPSLVLRLCGSPLQCGLFTDPTMSPSNPNSERKVVTMRKLWRLVLYAKKYCPREMKDMLWQSNKNRYTEAEKIYLPCILLCP